jgi:hypothetical protein
MNNNTINISKSRQRISGAGVIDKEPKTGESNRTIPFPTALGAKLRFLRIEQSKATLILGEKYSRSNYVATYADG